MNGIESQTQEQAQLDYMYKEILGSQSVSIAKLNVRVQMLIQENANLTARLAEATKRTTELEAKLVEPKPGPRAVEEKLG